jgi:hypothetical protein
MPLPLLAAGAASGLLKSGLGKTILSGVKNTIGANPLGLAVGAGQLALGAKKTKKADAMMPPPEDVGERALLNTLRRREQALSTGTAYKPQITAANQAAKTFAKNSFNAGGPVNMGAYSGIMSQTLGNITQQTSQDMAQNLGLQGKLITDMANRKSDLTLLQRADKNAKAADLTKSGGQNLMAAIMPSDQEYKLNELGETKEEARKRKREELNAQKEQNS